MHQRRTTAAFQMMFEPPFRAEGLFISIAQRMTKLRAKSLGSNASHRRAIAMLSALDINAAMR